MQKKEEEEEILHECLSSTNTLNLFLIVSGMFKCNWYACTHTSHTHINCTKHQTTSHHKTIFFLRIKYVNQIFAYSSSSRVFHSKMVWIWQWVAHLLANFNVTHISILARFFSSFRITSKIYLSIECCWFSKFKNVWDKKKIEKNIAISQMFNMLSNIQSSHVIVVK